MTDKDHWGPWIEHDGSGCPCVGYYVHRVYDKSGVDSDGKIKREKVGVIRRGGRSWEDHKGCVKVVRYRIKKPRGLIVLQDIAKTPQRELEMT